MDTIHDLLIVGGGINGTGIAADASGRGLKVFLCEQNDLASGTSSASSKLIHGGLRYLEHYEFRLVREALSEREVLLGKAPHLVSPLRFTMPHRPHLRPAWMIRCGLFLYDHLSSKCSLPRAKTMAFANNTSPFKSEITKGFQYYDCWVDDARLVVSNAIEAKEKGATIATQTRCQNISFIEDEGCWLATLNNKANQSTYSVKAKHIINASGPWLNSFLETAVPSLSPRRKIRLIKGSHIVVPRIKGGDEAFILQNKDKRIVFVLPYQQHFSIIGTTDKEYQGDPAEVQIDEWEVDYLLEVFNEHFLQDLGKEDIVSSYSGVRPLCDDESDDPSAITRDYTLELQQQGSKNALISIYGGKITTYRKLAEAVLDKLQAFYTRPLKTWTASSSLPGCDYFGQSRESIRHQLERDFKWLPSELAQRFSCSYGNRCRLFLRDATHVEGLGKHFGHGLYSAEVDYLIEFEWAHSVEDILWRRSKLGLHFNQEQLLALDSYIQTHKVAMHSSEQHKAMLMEA